MNTFVYVLIAHIFVAPHHPQNKTYPPMQFPDQEICFKEAEKFLDHFEPTSPDGHVVAACIKKLIEERKS